MGADDSAYPVDAKHWLNRFTPQQWLTIGAQELAKAEEALRDRNLGAGVVGLKRAAGMALNGALRVLPDRPWGRTYVEHLQAIGKAGDVPEEVRVAAQALAAANPPTGGLAVLQRPSESKQLCEAARTVMAHAYAVVYGSVGRQAAGESA